MIQAHGKGLKFLNEMTNGDNCQDGRFGQPADALFQAPVLYNLFDPMEGQERYKLGRFALSKIQEPPQVKHLVSMLYFFFVIDATSIIFSCKAEAYHSGAPYSTLLCCQILDFAENNS